MKIEQRNSDSQGVFLAKDNDQIIGEMTYVWGGGDGNFIINHTAVNSRYQDQGVGNSLVESAVEYARENNLTIRPLCSFARSVFDKNSSYDDVRQK